MSEILSFFVGVTLMLSLLSITTNETITEVELVERGYGLYCPSDGFFAFIGECNE